MGFSASPTGEIIVTKSSIKWAVLPDEGLFAFKIKGAAANISVDQYRKVAVKSLFSNASTTLVSQFSGISAIAEDQSNQLWVGTNTGVVVYSNPDKVFDPGEFYGIQPSLDDTDGLFKPILAKEKITAIAVDGGNRKWIGTARSGVFLFSGLGDHLLLHFDSNNSPLPSDQILSIAIIPKSGEVFFATDRGLVSFVSDATAGRKSFDTAYAWPNPVRETFSGNVTIDGLADETDVRITDVAGNLVYRTSSLGGRAVWNAKNNAGNRVATGVYLIFCSSPLLNETKIIKLLVIH
jgi:ligand-binding sensor domain-containing protein